MNNPTYLAIGDTIESGFAVDPTHTTGYAYIVLHKDGSRRVMNSGSMTPTTLWSDIEHAKTRWPGQCGDVVYWDNSEAGEFSYLPYTAGPGSTSPTNQVPDLVGVPEYDTGEYRLIGHSMGWKTHLGTFAHDLDYWHGSRSAQDASGTDRDTVWRQFSILIGFLFDKVQTWGALSPTQATAGVLDWKSQRTALVADMQAACIDCDIATFPRRFLEHANLSRFRQFIMGGQLHGVDRSTTPWFLGRRYYQIPNLPRLTQEQAETAIREFFEGNEAHFNDAVKYYDDHVGHRDTPYY